jgi:hypothetical protein
MASVSMMHRSGFTARVTAILEGNRSRARISRTSTALLAIGAVVTTVVLSSLHPVLARAEQPAKALLPQAPPKWVGTWQLSKQDARFGSDPKIQEMLDSIDSLTLRLDSVQGGLKVAVDFAGIRPGQRQSIEYVLPFGVKTELKDLIPMAMFLPPQSGSVRPVGNDSLELVISTPDFVEIVSLQVSSDGNTLIESTTPSGFHLVWERR